MRAIPRSHHLELPPARAAGGAAVVRVHRGPELRRDGVRLVLRLLALPAGPAEDGVPRLLQVRRRDPVERPAVAVSAVDVAEVGGRDAGALGGVVEVEAGLGHVEAEAGPGVEADPRLGRQRAEVVERGGVRVGGGHLGPEVVPGRRDRREEDLGDVAAGAAVEGVGLALVSSRTWSGWCTRGRSGTP